jgi:hypothetical protein
MVVDPVDKVVHIVTVGSLMVAVVPVDILDLVEKVVVEQGILVCPWVMVPPDRVVVEVAEVELLPLVVPTPKVETVEA